MTGLAGTQAQIEPLAHMREDALRSANAGMPNQECDEAREGYCDKEAGICNRVFIYSGNAAEEEIYACDAEGALDYLRENAIENKMINDDLGQMLMELEKTIVTRTRNVPVEERNEADEIALITLRKFKNLKAMVMTLQPVNVTVFGRYCYYGCWCLPNGMHNLAAGYGAPVDQIDAVCKEFALCYKCLEIDFGGNCDPEARAYRWGRIRFEGIPVDLECKDKPETGPTHRCKRYTCECDRVLAMGLSEVHWYWNESFHSRWGDFNREEECFTGCNNDGSGCPPVDDCCGAYGSASHPDPTAPVRRPYYSGGVLKCCQDVWFFDNVNKVCCDDGLGQDDSITLVDPGNCALPTLAPDAVDDFSYAK